jgi:hypothetical protein
VNVPGLAVALFEAAAARRGFEGADGIQWRQQSALQRRMCHDVSFSDLVPENNSFVVEGANRQIVSSDIFASMPPIPTAP